MEKSSCNDPKACISASPSFSSFASLWFPAMLSPLLLHNPSLPLQRKPHSISAFFFYLLLSSLHLLPRFPLYHSPDNEIIIHYVPPNVWFYFLVGLNESRLRHKGRKYGRNGRVRESSNRSTLTGFTGWLEKLGPSLHVHVAWRMMATGTNTQTQYGSDGESWSALTWHFLCSMKM